MDTVTLVVAGTLALLAGCFVLAGLSYRPPGRDRNLSTYVTMRDGVRIAVELWLPAGLKPGERLPALIKGTPYWRAFQLRFPGKAVARLGFDIGLVEPDVPVLNRRGFAVVTVDARGTGASSGTQAVMFDDPEIDDYSEIVDWVTAQPWSNGRVGAYGFSYRGMTAALMASLANPALKAVAPLFDFSDMYLTTHPGGVFAEQFVKAWSDEIATLGRGRFACRNLICPLLVKGPKPVDEDPDGVLLAQAIADHAANYDAHDSFRAAPSRDDPVGLNGKSATDVSVIARRAAIEARGLPMFVQAGYFDEESPAQALRRFRDFSNPQTVTIGPFSHGGFFNTDPYAPPGTPVAPSLDGQTGLMADFFDPYLRGDGDGPRERRVRYFVLGAGLWRETPVWPPADTTPMRWYLGAARALSLDPPEAESVDRYEVDPTARSGTASRYRSPVALSETRYRDRAKQDRKLLVYDGPALAEDIEIAGDPVATLVLASGAPDGTVIVYLEEVGSDGAVTYLSEGVLRLAHRKGTFLAADVTPMAPGVAEPIRIVLAPIAALIRAGHRIRVAIAGADADNLEPASAGRLTIQRNRDGISHIELPRRSC